MVDTHSFIPPMHNAKAKEIKVVDLAENMDLSKYTKTAVTAERFETTTPNRVEVDEWDCPFCKATVHETGKCECGAQLTMHAIRRS